MPRIENLSRRKFEAGKYYLIQCPLEFPVEGYGGSRCEGARWIEGFDPSLYTDVVLECLGESMWGNRVTEGLFNVMLSEFRRHPDDANCPNGSWAFEPKWVIREVEKPAEQQKLFAGNPND